MDRGASDAFERLQSRFTADTVRSVAGLLTVLVVSAGAVALWLAANDALLWVALVPLLLFLAAHYIVMGGRLRNPNGGSLGTRRLAAIAAGAFAVIGLGAIEAGAPVGGSAISATSALMLTFALRGVWSTHGPVDPGVGHALLPKVTLGLIAVDIVLMVGSWIERTHSIVGAIPLLIIALLGFVMLALGVHRTLVSGSSVSH